MDPSRQNHCHLRTTRLYDEKAIKEVSSDKRYLKSQWDMNVGMHCSINQLGFLQEVAEIGDPSVDPSSHICCLGSVTSSSRHDPLSPGIFCGGSAGSHLLLMVYLPVSLSQVQSLSPSPLHICYLRWLKSGISDDGIARGNACPDENPCNIY